MLDPIVKVLTDVFNWIHSVNPANNYGVDIIIFTILIKIVLLPFNILQTKSTVKTQAVQPKMKELQKKYKNDPQKLSQAQMELYKTEGVNPFGGCLPLLIQWPVLFAVFYVFRSFPFEGAKFLGLNLGTTVNKTDPIYIGVIYAILSGLTTYVSTLLLTPKDQEPNAMTSGSMNIFMSVFFGWVSWTMSAGLVVYWIVNNTLQMGIQYLLNKSIANKIKQTE